MSPFNLLIHCSLLELSASKLNASTTLTEGGHIKHLLEHRIVKLHWEKKQKVGRKSAKYWEK